MATTIEVRRNGKHPISQCSGFDFLFICADTEEELDVAVAKAEVKFWQIWTAGTKESSGKAGAVMYKPSGADSPWEDCPEKPHPGNAQHH